jgi:hypothetical protein
MRSYRLLIAAALFVPATLIVGAAWQSRAVREGEAEIVRLIAELRDNTKMAFDAETRLPDDHGSSRIDVGRQTRRPSKCGE